MEFKVNKRSLLLLILAVGFIVRIVGVDFGLPFLYHNDEPIIVNYALAYGAGDLNPHFFKIPPFLSYILFFLYGVYFLFGRAAGLFHGIDDFGYSYLNDPTAFYLIGRIATGVVVGTASILLIYELGKRLFSRKTGLIVAFFLALNFLHVRDSHYIYPDIPLVFLTLLYLILLYSLYKKDRYTDYLISGLTLALAVSMKYNGILLAVPTAFVFIRSIVLSHEEPIVLLKKLSLYFCFFIIGLFITNPFMFLDWKFFFARTGRMPFTSIDFWYHLRVSLIGSCGLLMCVTSVGGMIFAVLRKKNLFIISLISYVVFYYLVLAISSQPAERYIFPILPIVLLFSAYFVTVLIDCCRSGRVKGIVAVVCCFSLIVSSGLRIYHSDRLFLAEDTRTESYKWVTENIDPNSIIALDATGPVFPNLVQKKEIIMESFRKFDDPKFDTPKQAMGYKVKLLMSNPDYPEDSYRIYYLMKKTLRKDRFLKLYPKASLDMKELNAKGVQYVIANRLLLSNYCKPFLKELEKGSDLLKEFLPYKSGRERVLPLEESSVVAAPFSFRELADREMMGPVIRIYRLR